MSCCCTLHRVLRAADRGEGQLAGGSQPSGPPDVYPRVHSGAAAVRQRQGLAPQSQCRAVPAVHVLQLGCVTPSCPCQLASRPAQCTY